MDLHIFLYLSSGLFLGWSLGANDAANVFGTAVASRMIKFRTAAIIITVGVIIGAVISGAGAAHTPVSYTHLDVYKRQYVHHLVARSQIGL